MSVLHNMFDMTSCHQGLPTILRIGPPCIVGLELCELLNINPFSVENVWDKYLIEPNQIISLRHFGPFLRVAMTRQHTRRSTYTRLSLRVAVRNVIHECITI